MFAELRCAKLASKLNALMLATVVTAHAVELPEQEEDEFHFVVLGDSQFHDLPKFNRVIDQARLLQPAFVIQVGDLIRGYSNDIDAVALEWVRFKKQVAPLGNVTYFPVPGNHDVYNGERRVDKRLEDLYEANWGPIFHAFDYKNVQFTLLNSDSTEGENQIGPEQFAWLDATLRESNADHKMAFVHKPPLLMENADALHKLFVQHGVSHVFYGHFHHYHYQEKDGVHYSMTNAAANMGTERREVGSFHQLLQVSVRGDDVTVAVIDADSINRRDIVSATDNSDLFVLLRSLAPRDIEMQEMSEGAYRLTIPVQNPGTRNIHLLVTCTSDDNRWQFNPLRIAPLNLDAGGTSSMQIDATFALDRQPESNPVCTIRVPYQTSQGQWIDYNHSVTGSWRGQE